MKKYLFFVIALSVWIAVFSGGKFYGSCMAASKAPVSPEKAEGASARAGKDADDEWVAMPAGARPSYMGIHGGTMPVSLLVSGDGSSLLGYVGQTGNDFLEVLRKAYLPFPSFANATREKFHSLSRSADPGRLSAGGAAASLPVLSFSASPAISASWIRHFQPFGLSDEPLSIEGNVSRPEIIPLPKKYRTFFLPDKFFPSKK